MVVKSNDLVNARYDWTALQHRLILMMIAELDPTGEDDDFGVQTVHVADLLEQAQLVGNSHYERAVEAAQVLLDQKVYVRLPDGRWRGYNLLSYVEPGPGWVKARFNQDMRPFLLQLKQRFTRYRLRHALRFQSPYSTRIFELCMQFADIGYRTVGVEELRELLVLEDKYPRFYDFKRRVLEQARREINRDTHIRIAFEMVKDGRQVVAVRFTIRPAKRARPAPTSQTDLFPEGQEGERDAFDDYVATLDDERRTALRKEAEDRIERDGLTRWQFEMQVELLMRQIWDERREEP